MEILPEIILTKEWKNILEWAVLGCNFLYIVFLIREMIVCWIFGIVGSLLAVIIWVSSDVRLYSEAILYLIYAILGVYGWITWHRGSEKKLLPIVVWEKFRHVKLILVGSVFSVLLGMFMNHYTTADMPWVDSTTTTFSLMATWMEAKKVLEGWYYWIIINLASIFIYWIKDVHILSGMMAIYAVLSVVGLIQWRKRFALEYQKN